LAVWTVLAYFLWSDIYRRSDTAALVYMTEATGRSGVPYNQISITNLDANAVEPLDASEVCNASLSPGPESYPNGSFSHLEYHAYYFVYALAPLTWLLPSELVIGGTQALAMAMTILLVYVILRQERVGIGATALFCAFVAAYPVFNEALPGSIDLYMDRYFPPLALLYLAIAWYGLLAPSRPWVRFWPAMIPVGILAASTNDRSILYIIGATLFILAMLWRRALGPQWRAAVALLCFSLALAVAFFAYMTYVHTSDVHTISDFAVRGTELAARLTSSTPFRFDQTYSELSLKFVLLNIVLFGLWALWRWKLMLLAIAAMLPNIVTTIGGAEKIQFGFHYHAQYLPFIVFAATLGFAVAWRSLPGLHTRVFPLVLAVLAVGMVTFDPYQPGLSFSADGAGQSGWFNVAGFYFNHSDSDVVWRRSIAKELDAIVPKGVWVTGIQASAGFLYPGRHWFFYPMAIDSADYAVLPVVTAPDGSTYFGGAETYLAPPEDVVLNQCLTQRLVRDGYDVGHPQIVGPLAVLHRSG
jgi:uncharacterized membrane protein